MKTCTTAALLTAAALMLCSLAVAVPLDCPINRHADWEIIAGKNISQLLINIKLSNGSCVEVHDQGTPTTFTTSRARGCTFCIEGHCVPVPRLPSPPTCDSVQGPDCGQYFTAKGNRAAPCADANPLLSSLSLAGKKSDIHVGLLDGVKQQFGHAYSVNIDQMRLEQSLWRLETLAAHLIDGHGGLESQPLLLSNIVGHVAEPLLELSDGLKICASIESVAPEQQQLNEVAGTMSCGAFGGSGSCGGGGGVGGGGGGGSIGMPGGFAAPRRYADRGFFDPFCMPVEKQPVRAQLLFQSRDHIGLRKLTSRNRLNWCRHIVTCDETCVYCCGSQASYDKYLMRMRLAELLLLCLATAFSSCLTAALGLKTEDDKVFRVGAVLESGDTVLEIALRRAVEVANGVLDRSKNLHGYRLVPDIRRISDSDSFNASLEVCSLLETGVVAIVGPTSGQASEQVRSVCEYFAVPHIETNWNYRLPRPNHYTVNLSPHFETYSQALSDYIKTMVPATRTAVIYDDPDSLLKFEGLLNAADSPVLVRQWAKRSGTYKYVMKELRAARISRFLVDIPVKKLVRFMIIDVNRVDLSDFQVIRGSNFSTLTLLPSVPPDAKYDRGPHR
uniref:ANF_receptor domain-containing protein n=1 Tax=Macrostomum lignano TaxID=282301 RepID=A0A1I8IPK4_9PLAT